MALFGKRKPRPEKDLPTTILIVEDEPLVAFDNEHFLRDAGYLVAATVDNAADAIASVQASPPDLVLADVRLSDGSTGIEVAEVAKGKGVPVMFVTGACPPEAQSLAVACLSKPYTQRDLLAAIEAVKATVAGMPVGRVPRGLTLFGL
ncbi:response regulator [Sphingomonas naphthae]|uniref:Response regulator n=1 Tax=Sphingomonas naphthae TaxID=1813468 RepID=A0ABY7TGM3_9SPHN|nr:response regulator [Sphingomonas naphthae]WCT72367.1 response regulator [Sphingomonas naphthae]